MSVISIMKRLFVLFICLLLSGCMVQEEKPDIVKFKEEYESLNGVEVTEDLKYSKLNISENNPIKYSNYDELLDIIKNKTGVIYLGFPECPWCRSALPILLDVVKDNDIKFVTVTDAKVTNDLSFAKIYFTVLDENRKKETLLALKNASKFIRRELADRIEVRHIPELEFVYDESIEYGKKIEDIIERINNEKQN